MVKQKTNQKKKEKEQALPPNELILHNDDFNTFDFVIESLIVVCGHEPEQAEQCAIITHLHGKCLIKTGSLDLLKTLHAELTNRKLTTTIE